MRYCKTINKECIAVHPLDDIGNTHYIELIKAGDVPMFAVWMDDGEVVWIWEFEMFTPSDYERVKMNVFDAVYTCDTMLELSDALDTIFREYFAEILIVDECAECDGCGVCNRHNR